MATNWAGLPKQPSFADTFLGDLKGGFGLGQMPRNAQLEQDQKRQLIEQLMLANEHQGMANQYYPQITEADIAYKKALAEKERNFGGLSLLSGDPREALSLELIRQQFGEDSHVFQNALDAYRLDQDAKRSTMETQDFYRKHPERFLTSTGKSFQEQQQAAQGNLLGTPGLTPEQSKNIVNTYEANRYNEKPAFLQQQALGAAQVDETVNLIDPDKAFQFSGAKGKADLVKERLEAEYYGKPSKKLTEYEEQQTYLHNLREQLRTYLGASITNGMTENLDYLVNPENWKNHPEIAKAKYRAVIKAYEKEKGRTLKAMESGNPFGSEPVFATARPDNGPSQQVFGETNESPNQNNSKKIKIYNKKTNQEMEVTIEEARAMGVKI